MPRLRVFQQWRFERTFDTYEGVQLRIGSRSLQLRVRLLADSKMISDVALAPMMSCSEQANPDGQKVRWTEHKTLSIRLARFQEVSEPIVAASGRRE